MKAFISAELDKAHDVSTRTTEELRSILTANARKYGWTDDGSLYIGGSLAREEMIRSSDIDLILFKSKLSRAGKYSSSAIVAFRTASMATAALNRKVTLIPVDDPERFALRYAPMAFRSGILKGKPVGLETFLTAENFEGEAGKKKLQLITGNLVGLASVAGLDRDCARNGFNGYRFATLASALAEIHGTIRDKEDAETFRKLLFVYCSVSERVNGHCGIDGAEAIIAGMTEEERSEGGVNLLDAVESARSGVKRLLTSLCQVQ